MSHGGPSTEDRTVIKTPSRPAGRPTAETLRAVREAQEALTVARQETNAAQVKAERYAEALRFLASELVNPADVTDPDVVEILRDAGVYW